MTDLHDAWDELHAATLPGWFVGRPGQRYGGQWAVNALDTTERAAVAQRSREWTAVGWSEVECLLEVAWCLREIAEGGGRARTNPYTRMSVAATIRRAWAQ